MAKSNTTKAGNTKATKPATKTTSRPTPMVPKAGFTKSGKKSY